MFPPDTRSLYRSQTGHFAVLAHYSAMLRRYPVPYESFYVPTRYGVTHIVVSGRADNPPVVLLHGLAVHAMMWKPNIAALSQHFQVYAVDVIGDGGRSAPTRPSILDDSYANWLVDVLDELAIPQVNLVGMSLGGWLALSAALYHSERVRRVCLIAPAGIVTLNTSLTMQWLFTMLPHTWETTHSAPRLLAKLSKDPEIQQMVYLATKHHHPKRVPPAPILSDDELRRINTPTSIIIGERDEMFHAGWLVNRAKKITGFKSAEIVYGAGHAINVNRTEHANNRLIYLLGAEL